MEARYRYSPERHKALVKHLKDVGDKRHTNSILMTLAEALVRSGKIDTKELVLVGVTEDGGTFGIERTRIPERHYPSLLRLYKNNSRNLRPYVLGEVLAEAARFLRERKEEAGMLLLNRDAHVEEIGDSAYPSLDTQGQESPRRPMISEAEGQASEDKADELRPVNGINALEIDFDEKF